MIAELQIIIIITTNICEVKFPEINLNKATLVSARKKTKQSKNKERTKKENKQTNKENEYSE